MVNNCIGARNMRSFVMFIFLIHGTAAVILVTTGLAFARAYCRNEIGHSFYRILVAVLFLASSFVPYVSMLNPFEQQLKKLTGAAVSITLKGIAVVVLCHPHFMQGLPLGLLAIFSILWLVL
jgi:hypothetical protein